MTLAGTTRPHSLGAQVAIGVDTLRAHGEFRIRQSDYGIALDSIAGGSLKIQDELKFGFYIVAQKREAAAQNAR